MNRYGFPYHGSKSSIAEWVIDNLPTATHYYDLFAGGCAISHCAKLSGKYEKIFVNDINPQLPQLFIDAVNGKYKNECTWISRDMFDSYKDVNPYIRYIWSFGNGGRSYLYSKKNEPIKKAYWMSVFCDTAESRRRWMREMLKNVSAQISLELKQLGNSFNRLQSLEQLERLQSLEQLERLQSLESCFIISGVSYSDVDIKPDSVIYCDIPYRNTVGYDQNFDYEKFYDWACAQTTPVFISEVSMPEDRFVAIASREVQCRFQVRSGLRRIEKLFRPRTQV